MGDPFYADGLRFACARCSKCCTGEPGYVFLTKGDLRRLLDRFSLAFKDFFREYCTLVDTGLGLALSLRESARQADDVARQASGGDHRAKPDKPSFDCVFWAPGGCSVYDDRPIQCSTYPFWDSIISSSGSWEDEAFACPGIGKGELRSRSYIQERLLARRETGTILLGYGVDPECTDEDSILGS